MGAITLNGTKVTDVEAVITPQDAIGVNVVVRRGEKKIVWWWWKSQWSRDLASAKYFPSDIVATANSTYISAITKTEWESSRDGHYVISIPRSQCLTQSYFWAHASVVNAYYITLYIFQNLLL